MNNLFADERPPLPQVILRPYQQQMVNAWQAFIDKGGQRGLIIAATGAGKTVLFSSIVRAMAESDLGFTALALAHRKELLEQIAGTMDKIAPHLNCSIHSGDLKADRISRVVAASVQSLAMPGSEALQWLAPNLVICDESHHAAADSYQRVFSRFGCYDEPGTYLLGVTATPHRLDNKALVGSASKAIFEEIVFRYDIVQAIKDGFLVDLRGYRAQADVDLSKVKTRAGEYVQSDLEEAMNVDPVNELALRSWKDAAAGRQTIIFCSGVDHAKKVAEVFREGGIAAEAIYGDMPRVEREAAIERFRAGKTTVLTNMDILTEGFDSQACSCVVMLRPTKSWSLFVQMCGRALRVLPGVIDGLDNAPSRREAISRSPKIDCLVIDIVGLTSSHQLTAKANGQGDPCLNALVGLPSEMDLEGRSVVEALEEFEELPEIVKAAAFRRKTSFSGLSAVLTQVEMLAEIEPPEEAVEAGADLYWMKIGDSDYIVDCGTSPQGIARSAAISADLLGNLTLRLSSGDKSEGRALRDQEFELDSDLQVAFIQAEAIIQKNFFGVARLASRKAQWRLGSPTQAQLSYLKSCGIHEDVLHTLTKGTASAMIGMLRRKGIGPQKEVA